MMLLVRLFLSLQILLLGGFNSLNAGVQQGFTAPSSTVISEKAGLLVSALIGHPVTVKSYFSIARRDRAVLDNDEDTEDSSKKQLKADNVFRAVSYPLNPGNNSSHYIKKCRQYGRLSFYASCPTHILYRVIRI